METYITKIKMGYEEYKIENNYFKYLNMECDCEMAIKFDKEVILHEAEISHKDTFDELYNRDSLMPIKVRLFIDDKQNPVYGMIIYTINYKNQSVQRTACGNYYPVWTTLSKLVLMPHPYQGSICW